jgi:hypothetical protein
MSSFLNQISMDRSLGQVNFRPTSAWTGHAPFLKFLIPQLNPKIFVELGTHNGFSYFTGCQSIVENNLSTKAFAVDHWEGDAQAGLFGPDVFKRVELQNYKFRKFSKLLKMTFDDARSTFADETIELLHIDGFHSYDGVSHDFNSWLPKMSKNGIVILHDIHIRKDTYEVWKFWEEIKAKYQTIEFTHSYGLGVVFLGEITGNRLKELVQIFDSGKVFEVQGVFAALADELTQFTFSHLRFNYRDLLALLKIKFKNQLGNLLRRFANRA